MYGYGLIIFKISRIADSLLKWQYTLRILWHLSFLRLHYWRQCNACIHYLSQKRTFPVYCAQKEALSIMICDQIFLFAWKCAYRIFFGMKASWLPWATTNQLLKSYYHMICIRILVARQCFRRWKDEQESCKVVILWSVVLYLYAGKWIINAEKKWGDRETGFCSHTFLYNS